ncbi:hypothetical protein [Stenotrophomonas sp. 24(2023)]|uniref:hypothetical protein n=1 Tax=Stenotrophomonas sp. 24(2023) TaxID=3068324 RepID=UPI0027E1E179|nr:hypothetical protein [Stenotrophomonas sp. 24(2023)]WMJ68633.1 hypothetical protein Q9R17_15760 [Stenotrophomonas sp. 24(2023)]
MPILDTPLQGRSPPAITTLWSCALAPPLAALALPFLLMVFHAQVGPPGTPVTTARAVLAVLVLACAFAAPVLGIVVAGHRSLSTRLRRLAYASVLAPTLYVFLGVVQALLGSPVADPWVWCALWLAAMAWSVRADPAPAPAIPPPVIARWRVAHGISAVVVCLYVLFHLGNHLTGLLGTQRYAAVMEAGRQVYRAGWIEPLLVAAVLFQIGSGLRLAWYWSAARQDAFRTFQIASGAYLSAFMLGHMNSVFIYARTYLGIPTDWNFATGAPTGLIHDPWNIRLLPHYALGVFFVLGHLVAGLRVVLNAHGVARQATQRLWWAGMVASALIATAIMAGMCGARL